MCGRDTFPLSDWKEPKARSFEPEISQHPLYYSTHCTFLWPTCYFCLLFIYLFTFTFTFMHLADAFIQSDLHCIQVTVFTFDQLFFFIYQRYA